MKNLFLLALLTFTLAVSGCKKEDDKTNTNNNNNNNNQPDTRTGLERLANPASTNYCVLVIGTDTSIWQTTAADTIETRGGISQLFPASYYFYGVAYYNSTHSNARLKTFALEFERFTDYSHYYNHSYNCNTLDSLVLKGNIPPDTTLDTKYRFYITLTDSVNNRAETRLGNDTRITINSITPITNGTNCKKLRVKGTLGATNLYNDICGPVPVFMVKQGAFQMDFKMPG
ncbi:MAG: hypothetical protein KA149_06795 [Chitinophagales bacterium]|nr:hypothetical protein [Chitinophagales bacterium]